jgi:opine dehydrogenase
MNVAVLGAGNGGCTATADLTQRGFNVNLFESPEFEQNIKPIIKRGGVQFAGAIGTGLVQPKKVTTNMREAIADVDLIMVVTPAFAHQNLARKVAPYLRNQIVVVNPGHTGGAILFAKVLRENGFPGKIRVGETMVLTYICRLIEPGNVKVFHVMKNLLFAAFPSQYTDELYDKFRELYPSIVRGINVLETGLTNLAAVMHPPGMLLNTGWIEFTHGQFKFYFEGITPSVARVVQALDEERLRLMQSVNLKQVPAMQWYYRQGCTPIETNLVYEAFQAGGPDQNLKAPDSLDHRYVVEEVNYGLVPMASIGRMLDVPTPNMDAIIRIASTASQRDFWAEGLTTEKLGIAGMSSQDLNRFLEDGKRESFGGVLYNSR